MPLYARDIGASLEEVGLVSSSFMIVASTLSVPLGLFSDRLGRRRLIILGLSLLALIPFGFPSAKSIPLLIMLNALAGLGSAAYSPSMTALVGGLVKNGVGKSMGAYTTAMQIGMSLGPVFGGALKDRLGYEAVFISSGLVSSLALIVCVLKIPKAAKDTREGLRLEADLNVYSCWLATFSISFFWGVINSYLPIFGRECLSLQAFEISLIFAAQSVSNALFRVPLGYIVDKSPSPYLLLSIGLSLSTVVTKMLPMSWSLLPLTGLMAVFGLAMAVVTITTTSAVAQRLPEGSRGLGMGIYYTCFYGGLALSPIIMGSSIASSYREGFALTSLAGLVGLAATIFGLISSRNSLLNSRREAKAS
jgi:MFS family permease